MLNDDQREAAKSFSGISTGVVTVVLALLAGQVALFTYLSQNYSLGAWFYGITAVAAVAFVGSCVCGALGTAELTRGLYDGVWSPHAKARWYDWQFYLSMIGLGSLLVSVPVGLGYGPSRQPSRPSDVVVIQRQLTGFTRRVRIDEQRFAALRVTVGDQAARILKDEHQIEMLAHRLARARRHQRFWHMD